MDPETVKRVAVIARMSLTDDETKRFSEEICGLFAIVNVMNDAPESDSFCFDPIGVADVLRDDVPIADENAEEMLKGMSTHDGYVRGPKIV
jgi:aspartyl/glutamyl-tRNA(Asn/Gln) amidotransferase C subunit